MSKRAATKNPAGKGRGAGKAGRAAGAFYLYCVGAESALGPLFEAELPEAIEETSGLELVTAGGLAAVTSAVPLRDYGEEALPERLADPAWTAARALRHERVVHHFARRAAVVPLRFGTIFLARESIGRMLGEERDRLRASLDGIEGHDEWGLNLYVSRARLREGVEGVSPRLREMAERAASLPPGQAYLLRKKIEALRDAEAREQKKLVVSEVLARLGRLSAAAGRLRTAANESAEQGEVAAKLYFHVGRAVFEEFRAEAERAAEEFLPLGFSFELTGPWPAYNFVRAAGGALPESADD